MKKKGRNEIPDFSKKRKGTQPQHGVPDATNLPQHAPSAPPVRTGKPPATSMKSGRRGS